ncbi:MAG TPA: hypothetical protein V6C95_15190 [Coleofasciculaceae cyanobacterium]
MENWFRYVLMATALLNLGGAIAFAPPIHSSGEKPGLPQAHPFYLWTLSSWILILGVAYFWMALTAQPERLFIAVAAAAKLAIAFLLFAFWIVGELPLTAMFVGCADLFFAIAFIYWLFQTR